MDAVGRSCSPGRARGSGRPPRTRSPPVGPRSSRSAATPDRTRGRRGAVVRTPVLIDLADLAERPPDGGETLLALPGRIDVLALNAGRDVREHAGSRRDGIEATFQTNHVGHFLLERLLHERLVEDRALVVFTCSLAVHLGPRLHRGRPAGLATGCSPPTATRSSPASSSSASSRGGPAARGSRRSRSIPAPRARGLRKHRRRLARPADAGDGPVSRSRMAAVLGRGCRVPRRWSDWRPDPAAAHASPPTTSARRAGRRCCRAGRPIAPSPPASGTGASSCRRLTALLRRSGPDSTERSVESGTARRWRTGQPGRVIERTSRAVSSCSSVTSPRSTKPRSITACLTVMPCATEYLATFAAAS